MTLWGADTVRDVAESVGVAALNKEVQGALCRDVEYRISQVLEEALKFMRHARRTTLWTQDIAQALRVLDVEPLYGYESTRPLRYGEASLGPSQPLFYVEDEEMDFEKLINAPLPKVPREISYTAHWLAIEGVQPSIPQNPSTTESRSHDLLPKGPTVNPALLAMSSSEATTTKPQVKHILSKELQLYFEKVCEGALNETEPDVRTAALASLQEDPGLHQLVPYFVQFVAEKVTHNLKDLFVLTQMMMLTEALTRNQKLNLTPYVASLVPPVLTCLTGRHLGTAAQTPSLSQFDLRDLAASLLKHLCDRYSKSSHSLKPRLARSCLKTFLDPKKPMGSHYGAVLGLRAVGGAEVVRKLIVPNLKAFEEILTENVGNADDGTVKRSECDRVIAAIIDALGTLVDRHVPTMNGHSEQAAEELNTKVEDVVGAVIGGRIVDSGHLPLMKALVESEFDI